jgi:hypothetical protein
MNLSDGSLYTFNGSDRQSMAISVRVLYTWTSRYKDVFECTHYVKLFYDMVYCSMYTNLYGDWLYVYYGHWRALLQQTAPPFLVEGSESSWLLVSPDLKHK